MPPDVDVDWPNGLTVQVVTVEEDIPTLAEIMAKYRGIATDRPEDLAENHDHYLHGTPKKKK